MSAMKGCSDSDKFKRYPGIKIILSWSRIQDNWCIVTCVGGAPGDHGEYDLVVLVVNHLILSVHSNKAGVPPQAKLTFRTTNNKQ